MVKRPDTEIYALNINSLKSEKQFHSLLSQLPANEKLSILRFHRCDDRKRRLLATVLVKKLLAKKLNLAWNKIRIGRTPYGRPYLLDEMWQGDFNISHSGDWVICAISSGGKTGIDVQWKRPIDLRIVKKCLTDDETQFVFSKNKEECFNYFYKLWTLKESFIKAIGLGFYFSPKDIEFDVQLLPLNIVKIKRVNYAESCHWHFKLYRLGECYQAALCTEGFDAPSEITIIPNIQDLDKVLTL